MNKLSNTPENKARFFAQYWGQKILLYSDGHSDPFNVDYYFDLYIDKAYLELTPLSKISDEDAIEVAKMAHQMYDGKFKANRVSDRLIHVTHWSQRTQAEYHVSINELGSINANLHFHKIDENHLASSHKVNIGEVQLSSRKPLGYIYIVDYLRSKGYALPYIGLSVEDLIEYGWVQLKGETK